MLVDDAVIIDQDNIQQFKQVTGRQLLNISKSVDKNRAYYIALKPGTKEPELRVRLQKQ